MQSSKTISDYFTPMAGKRVRSNSFPDFADSARKKLEVENMAEKEQLFVLDAIKKIYKEMDDQYKNVALKEDIEKINLIFDKLVGEVGVLKQEIVSLKEENL